MAPIASSAEKAGQRSDVRLHCASWFNPDGGCVPFEQFGCRRHRSLGTGVDNVERRRVDLPRISVHQAAKEASRAARFMISAECAETAALYIALSPPQ